MINEIIMEKWVNVFNETFKNNSNKVLYIIWVQVFQELIIKNCVKNFKGYIHNITTKCLKLDYIHTKC